MSFFSSQQKRGGGIRLVAREAAIKKLLQSHRHQHVAAISLRLRNARDDDRQKNAADPETP